VVFESNKEADLIFEKGFEPIDAETNVHYAVQKFDQIYTAGGIAGVQKYLDSCYPEPIKAKFLPSVINCAAIDYAGSWMDYVATKSGHFSPQPYFEEKTTLDRVKSQLLNFSNGEDEEKLTQISGILRSMSIKKLREFIQEKAQTGENH
jgi:hypothetical protein